MHYVIIPKPRYKKWTNERKKKTGHISATPFQVEKFMNLINPL